MSSRSSRRILSAVQTSDRGRPVDMSDRASPGSSSLVGLPGRPPDAGRADTPLGGPPGGAGWRGSRVDAAADVAEHAAARLQRPMTGGATTLAVRCAERDGLTVVTVGGDVGVDTTPRLRTVLKAAVDSGQPVLIDLVAVRFIDRAGFAALAAAHRHAHDAGTSLLLRTAPAGIPRLLALLGVDPAPARHPDC
jgi:anti-sigma B factor antagonist